MGWLAGWSWAKEISLTGQAGAGTLYQVELDIGDSAGGDFHLEGHCTNFPQDIAVTDDDGTTLIDFWIEDIAVDPLKMWVEVADDLGSNQKIWVYYGKSGASTNSDGTDTFVSFFDGDSTGWTKVDPNSHLAFTNNRLDVSGLGRNEDAYVHQSLSQDDEIILEWTYYINSGGDASALAIFAQCGDELDDAANLANGFFTWDFATANTIERAYIRVSNTNYGGTDAAGMGTNTQYWVRTIRSGNTVTTYWYSDSTRSTLIDSSTVTQAGLPTLSHVSMISTWNSGLAAYWSGWLDDFRVRKYNSPEPAFSSAGAEQSAPSVGAIMNQFQKANMGADLYNGAIIA